MVDSKKNEKVQVAKFTLGTGKVIYLRDPEIGDTEHATKIAGKEAGPENEAHLSVLFQKEMIKLLLVQVDKKKLTLQEKQDLKKLFTFKEYGQVSKAIKMMVDDGEGNLDLTPEHTTL
jgi:hypothetical protein